MTTAGALGDYIDRLRAGLRGMTLAEREEIVEEIRAHVRDRAAASGTTVEQALARLGAPEALAADYVKGSLLRRAGFSFSPWLILRTAFAWAMTGIHGFTLFLTALFGYALGAGFGVLGLLKPMFPEKTGLWVAEDYLAFGFRPDIPDAHDLLGPWFTQIAFALCALFIIGTTWLMRRLIPRFQRWKIAATGAAGLAAFQAQ